MAGVRLSGVALVCVGVLVAGCSGGPAETGAPSSPRTATSAVEPAEPSGPVDAFTVVASGDVLVHPALTEQAEADGGGVRDFTQLFAGVRPVVEAADLAICHLEVPLAAPGGPVAGYPLFSAPPEVATALAATGYDTCSTASNHTFDQGAAGVRSTLDALDAAGVGHTGSARSGQEAATPLVRDVDGVKVGQVSFTFGYNRGAGEPADSQWMSNELSVPAVLDAARAARAAGAEVVIASLHWGVENRHEPTADQRAMAREILADPAVDLVVGHHAHVVQPFEKVGDKWVAYGLGNHVARHAEPRGATEEGVIARFRFARTDAGWRVDRAEYVPTLVDLGPPIRLRDLTTDGSVAAVRRQEALDRTDGVVTSLAAPGLARP